MFFPDGRVGYVTDSPETPCIRAHRLRLRQVLARDVDIQWGKKAQKIEESEEGEDRVTVWFEDGTHAVGSVVVGADGTFSAGLLPPPLFHQIVCGLNNNDTGVGGETT